MEYNELKQLAEKIWEYENNNEEEKIYKLSKQIMESPDGFNLLMQIDEIIQNNYN